MLKKKLSIQNYIELSKPRILFFCIIMTAGGIVLAPGNVSISVFIFTIVGTALSVASANSFNMIYEKESDKLMRRTRFRPLPMGRISNRNAIIFAISVGLCGISLLAIYVNLLTAFLASIAIFSYSLIYTYLKYKTPLALVIGAFPGAMPPLLGWTAVSNNISFASLALFGILFAWQMPHFIAIAIYHKDDYARAGIRVVSAVRGDQIAKIQALLWTFILIGISLLLVPLKVGGYVYLVFAICLGLWILRLSINGLQKNIIPNWPRKFFLASLVYLPILIIGLVVDKFFWIMISK